MRELEPSELTKVLSVVLENEIKEVGYCMRPIIIELNSNKVDFT
jgi:hypothetical protein